MNFKDSKDQYGIAVNGGEVIIMKPTGFTGYRAFHKDYPDLVGSGREFGDAAKDIYRQVEARKNPKPQKPQEAPKPIPRHDLPQPAESGDTGQDSGLWFEAPDNWPAVVYPPINEGVLSERSDFVCVHNFSRAAGFGPTVEEAVKDMAQRLSVGSDYETLLAKARHIDRIRPIPEIQGLHDLLSFVLGTFNAAMAQIKMPLDPPPHSEGILVGLCWALGHKGATEYVLEGLVKPVLEHIEFDGTETVFGEHFDMHDLAKTHDIEKDEGE